jgi:hypothetical protein
MKRQYSHQVSVDILEKRKRDRKMQLKFDLRGEIPKKIVELHFVHAKIAVLITL